MNFDIDLTRFKSELEHLKSTTEVLFYVTSARSFEEFLTEVNRMIPGIFAKIDLQPDVKRYIDGFLYTKNYRYFFMDGKIYDMTMRPWPKGAYAYQTIEYLYKDEHIDEEIIGRERFYNRECCIVENGLVYSPSETRIFHSYDRLV